MTSSIVRQVSLGSPAALPQRTRLSLADGIRFEEWREIGQEIDRYVSDTGWWIGDWLVYGERFREEYHAAMDQLDREYASLAVYRWVSDRVKPITRVKTLSWAHHRAVAGVKPEPPNERDEEAIAELQTMWLEEALRHEPPWSSRQLEDAIQRHKPQRPTVPQLSVRGEELFEMAARCAERRGIEPRDWLAEAVREKAERETLALEAA